MRATGLNSAAVHAVNIAPDVRRALDEHRPVVAMESTVYSTLGLPPDAGAEALERSQAACAARGVTPRSPPSSTAWPQWGLSDADHDRLHAATTKVAERDLAVAIAHQVEFGATTVSASLALAARAGIGVFATGGIGGVHRRRRGERRRQRRPGRPRPPSGGHRLQWRQSVPRPAADARAPRDALGARARVARPTSSRRSMPRPVVCASPTGSRAPSKWPPCTRPDASWVAGARCWRFRCRPVTGSDRRRTRGHHGSGSALGGRSGVVGPAITPHVLATIAQATDGRAVAANVELVVHNAQVAADVAVALAPAPAP